MNNVNFVPKDIQRILSSLKISERYNKKEVFYKKTAFKNSTRNQKNNRFHSNWFLFPVFADNMFAENTKQKNCEITQNTTIMSRYFDFT